MIETVSEKGGHLGAGLGVADLTLALHYVLDTPRDFLVWDVGHQVQAHKIITGRKEAFRETFRQYKGISGLVNKDESIYDAFTTGHGGPSVSACLGVAVARRLMDKKGKVVAVIGDASIASGIAFEALNHAGHLGEDLVVILNDNEMSISRTVGALSKYLNRVISNPLYNRARKGIQRLITGLPRVGPRMIHKAKQIEEGIKHLLVPGLIFEALGFRYFGPLDGHNVIELVNVLPNMFKIKGPVLIHVITQKGKGYQIAERDPEKWHASTPFHVPTGEVKKASRDLTYTKVFGETIVELAQNDKRITALTGGMLEGTGLEAFQRRFPERLFDVGISEEHGVTFCAGLAQEGMRPFAAIYSTFLQRSHDQIIHDVALQGLSVIFAIDRAGLVGEDGPTHHGVFDIAYLRKIPGFVLMAPRDGVEFPKMLRFAVAYAEGPIAVRYPRGVVTEVDFPELLEAPRAVLELGKAEIVKEGFQPGGASGHGGGEILLVAYGALVGQALRASRMLDEQGFRTTVINARFAKPLDRDVLLSYGRRAQVILTLEDGVLAGGFGSAVLELFSQDGRYAEKVTCLGMPDAFIEHGPRKILHDLVGLSPEKIAQTAAERQHRAASGSSGFAFKSRVTV